MKYFAKLGLNSKVKGVRLVSDTDAPTEKAGIAFLHKKHNYPFWIQTFKDRSQRKNYPGVGSTYDEDRDAFIPKKPFASWVLNETTCQWEAAVAYPDDGTIYEWGEATTNWVEYGTL